MSETDGNSLNHFVALRKMTHLTAVAICLKNVRSGLFLRNTFKSVKPNFLKYSKPSKDRGLLFPRANFVRVVFLLRFKTDFGEIPLKKCIFRNEIFDFH